MNEEKKEEIKAKAEEALNALEEGAEFAEVAAEQADFGGQPVIIRPKADDKPILPEIRETFESLEDGEVSEVVETKHGYQILKRNRYQAEAYRPIGQVREEITRQLEQKNQQENFESLITELWEQDQSIELDEDVLANVYDEARADDVLLQIGDVKYTAGQFAKDPGRDLGEDSSLEERRDVLIKLPMVQRAVFAQNIEKSGLQETELYKKRAQVIENRYLSGHYGNQRMQELVSDEPTEKQLQEQFEEMRESLENQPSASVLLLSIPPISDKAPDDPAYQADVTQQIENMKAHFQDVETADDFKEAAAELEELGGELKEETVTRAFMRGHGAQFLQEEPGSISGPVYNEGKLHMAYIIDVSDRTDATLEEFRDRVKGAWVNENRQEAVNKLRESAKESADLEILFEQEG